MFIKSKYSFTFFLMASYLQAATPDAGSFNQDIEKQFERTTPLLKKPSELELKSEEKTDNKAIGVKILVSSFQLSGNTLITNEELQGQISNYIGQRLSFSELQNVVSTISNYYRAKGFMARAFLPPQEVTNGEIKIVILEGNLSGLEIDADNLKRFDSQKAKAIIEEAHPIGEKLKTKDLERGLLLLGDTPGIVSSGSLVAGENAGDSKLKVKIEDSSLYDVFTSYSNSGSKLTGTDQLSLSSNLNSPFSMGETLSLQTMATKGIRYVKTGVSAPVGYSGLKAGINASAMTYDVITDLDADGNAKTIGTWISYPLIRSTKTNLNLILNYDEKYYLNNVSSITTNDKTNKGFTLGLDGSKYDAYGQSNMSIALTRSKIDLSKIESDYLADQSSSQSNGSFSKLLLNVSRTQTLSETVYLSVSGTVQKSNKNLDSSEKLYLGGVNGVRAFPSNEAGGDEGYLINAEIVKSFSPRFSTGLFYDYGQIRQHKILYSGWQGASTADNTYKLKGVGVNLNYRYETWSAKATLAFKHQGNPNSQTDGSDNDGTNKDPRFWFQLSKVF